MSNLTPAAYIFCGDTGASSCSIGGTTYYLLAAVPYGGTNSLGPIAVPTYSASSPPATTYPFGGKNYLQKVRLMLSTSSSYPRVHSINPSDASQSSNLSNFAFDLTGANLTSGSDVSLWQGSTKFDANCSGSTGTQLSCTADIASASIGVLQLRVTSNGQTLSLPTTPLGGVNVTP
jgi:hypothetical protein